MIQIKYSRFVLGLIDVKHESCFFFFFNLNFSYCDVLSHTSNAYPHTDTLVGITRLYTVH